MNRADRLLPNGRPRYIACYDNEGKTFDRYTVVFTGAYTRKGHETIYIGMSTHPFHPQGFGQHGSSKTRIDRPRYSHLGKKITFESLPADCQKLVMQYYRELWDLLK